MRLPRWTPCFADPDDFDCSDCEIGFIAHCPLRTDEGLRSFQARVFRDRHAGGLGVGELTEIGRVAAATVKLGELAQPAGLIRERLGKGWSGVTEEQVRLALRSSPYFRETSPGMFQAVLLTTPKADDSADSITHSGSGIAENLASHGPLDPPSQIRGFRRLAGARLAASFPDADSGRARLERAIEDLADLVLPQERWSITDAASYATGSRQIPVSGRGYAPDRTALLSAMSAHELLQRTDTLGAEAERQRLTNEALLHNQRLIPAFAVSHSQGGFPGFSDLFHEGLIGLRRAIERFDAYRGYAFSTFATPWIRQAISRAVADHSHTIRLPAHAVEKLNQVKKAASALAERHPEYQATHEEIAREAEWDGARREFVRETGRKPTRDEQESQLARKAPTFTAVTVGELLTVSTEPARLDAPVPEPRDPAVAQLDSMEMEPVSWLRDLVPDPSSISAGDQAERTGLRENLAGSLSGLTPRERRVLELRTGFVDGRVRTLEEIGREFGVTRERIRQIEAKAIKKLKHPARSRRLQDYREPKRVRPTTSVNRMRRVLTSEGGAIARSAALEGIVEHAIARLGLDAGEHTRLQWLLAPAGAGGIPPQSADLSSLARGLAAVCLGASGRTRRGLNIEGVLTSTEDAAQYAVLAALTSLVVSRVVQGCESDFDTVQTHYSREHIGHSCPTERALLRLRRELGQYATGVAAGERGGFHPATVPSTEGQLIGWIIAGLKQVA